MGTLQEIEQVMRKTERGFSFLALHDHKLQIARGKATTGDRLVDYLVFDSDTPEELRERERSIKEISERLNNNIGGEVLVGHQRRDYTLHTYPGTFSGEHTYWAYELARIKTGDFEIKMEVLKDSEGDDFGKAKLILPVDGYGELSHGFGIHSREPEPFTAGSMFFPEHADVLAIGKKEIREWRIGPGSNESDYKKLKQQLQTGLAAIA